MRTATYGLICVLAALAAPGIACGEKPPSRCVEVFVSPAYPPLARMARIQGEVTAMVIIGPLGEVVKVEPISGHALLQDYALRALMQWRFCPARSSEEVTTNLQVATKFSLVGKKTDLYYTTIVKARLPNEVEVVTDPPEDIGPDFEVVEPKK